MEKPPKMCLPCPDRAYFSVGGFNKVKLIDRLGHKVIGHKLVPTRLGLEDKNGLCRSNEVNDLKE